MDWTIVAYAIAFFFAINIGASGTAAAMGPAYGSQAVKSRTLAMFLAGISAFLGAILGGEVVKTIGEGIISESLINVEVAIIILAGACLTLFIANMIGIPLSTSEVVVGSIVGVGIAYQSLIVHSLLTIMMFWVLVPIAAFFIAFVIGFIILKAEKKWPFLKGRGRWKTGLALLLVATGMVEAFAAGMNNVANAVGPLVGAGLISIPSAVLSGGLFLAIGCFLGRKVLETNGKKITHLSLLQGSAVSTTGGTLVIFASFLGIPIPLTQVTTSAIIGIGTAEHGFRLWQKSILKQIVNVWVLSPVVSLVVSYALMMVFIHEDIYTFIIILSVFFATIGSVHLAQTIQKEKRSVHNEGSGI